MKTKKKLAGKYPLYDGNEPYIYLCFTEEDARETEPLLKRFCLRGVRFFFAVKRAENIKEDQRLQERMDQASLVICVNSKSFVSSKEKGDMMYMQSKGIPVISVDLDRADNLSAGLKESAVHVHTMHGITEETESVVISSRGFTQDLIGTPGVIKRNGLLIGAVIGIIVLSILAVLFFGIRIMNSLKEEVPEEEDYSLVTSLELQVLPENFEELEKYPNLQKLILPQEEAMKAISLMDQYEIVLSGGEK